MCHRHSLFNNKKNNVWAAVAAWDSYSKKAINVNTRHHWTHDNKSRAESYYQQILRTFSKAATLVIHLSNHSWHKQLLDVSRQKEKKKFLVPLMRKWPHYWIGCVHKLSRSLDLLGSTWNYCLLTETLSHIFSVIRQNFIISGLRTSNYDKDVTGMCSIDHNLSLFTVFLF